MTQRLIWCDLETTGLSPMNDWVCEIALAEATVEDPFTIKRRFESLVWWPQSGLQSEVVGAMHTKSGLLAQHSNSLPGADEVDAAACDWLGHLDEDEVPPMLAGRNVGFDRDFLRFRLPNVAGRFHHRIWDVSSHEQLARHLGMPKLAKRGAHRAAADIDEAVEHSRAIVAWLRSREVSVSPLPRRVFVASPLRGDTARNVAYARRCEADAFARGEAPFVPHLYYTQSLDDGVPEQREQGMRAALGMLAGCELLAVYEDLGVSSGMAGEIVLAMGLGIPVEHRRIGS